MNGVNKVILIGMLGKDPEIYTLDGGKKLAKFSLATSETYKNKDGEKVENTTWHNIVCFSPLAEVCEKYLNKGSAIYCDGKIVNRTYEDKDGQKKYITEIRVDQMTMLGGKRKEEEVDTYKKEGQPKDDLPF